MERRKNLTGLLKLENYQGNNLYIDIPTERAIEETSLVQELNVLSYAILYQKPGVTTWGFARANALRAVLLIQEQKGLDLPFTLMGDKEQIFIKQE